MVDVDSVNLIQRLEDKVDRLVEVVSELKGSVIVRVESQDRRLTEQDRKLEDHEKRLRAQERFRYGWPSVAVIGVFVGMGTLLYNLHLHLHH